jgi:hypothetical protein
LLKLAAETLRDIILDGGFSDLAKQCGFKKEVYQWKDINTMLLAIHESLLREALAEWEEVNDNGVSFTDFLYHQGHNSNKDEVSKFWVMMLEYLNAYSAYFFAIRSGNWSLRLATLPKLSELFFAYSHNKYMELVCQHMKDIKMLPNNIRKQFESGQWTMTVKGSAYHNLALDEAHECLINRKLQELVRNPNEHNTVVLADFMAFLEQFLTKLKSFVYKYSNKKRHASKSKHNKFLAVIYSKIRPVRLFASTTQRLLINSFNLSATILDDEQRQDLLHISFEGKKRMISYIKQFVLEPPLEKPDKRRGRKLKTFSKKKSTVQSQQSKISRLSKMNKCMVNTLKTTGKFYDQVMDLPLALCDEFGDFEHKQNLYSMMF